MNDVPVEFSLGIMRRMSPFDNLIAKVGGCPYTHVVLRIDYNGQPYVYQSHPWLPWSPFKQSGPQRHSYDEYVNKVIPYWEAMPWAGGDIGHKWLSPPSVVITDSDRANARAVADWLVDRSGIKYGLFLNWLIKLPGFMHCSEFCDAVLWQVGLAAGLQDRTTPCDLYRIYTAQQQSQQT